MSVRNVTPITVNERDSKTVADVIRVIREVVRDINMRLTGIVLDEWENTSCAIVATSTPTAEKKYLGKFVLINVGGVTADVLKVCVWDGAAYTWKTVTIT